MSFIKKLFCKKKEKESSLCKEKTEEAKKENIPLTNKDIIKTLFKYSESEQCDERDNVHRTCQEIVICTNGILAVKNTSITYCAHNIVNNTGEYSWIQPIDFDELPSMIESSIDLNSSRFYGMDANNWKEYIYKD